MDSGATAQVPRATVARSLRRAPGAETRAGRLAWRRALLPTLAALALGSSAPPTGAASGAAVVATVTAAAGGQLYVLRTASGTLSPLKTGGEIQLGDVLSAGPGATATLELSPPAGLAADSDLFEVYKQLSTGPPAAGSVVKEFGVLAGSAHSDHVLRLRRSGSTIELTLSP